MKVLVLNCGSSTLKTQVIDSDSESCLARGVVDGIGKQALVELMTGDDAMSERGNVSDQEEAARIVLAWAGEQVGVDAVGHRVVHGGSRFVQPTLVNEDVIDAIDGMEHLAPLHNRPAIAAMRVAIEALPSTPSVAVFDTALPQRDAEEGGLISHIPGSGGETSSPALRFSRAGPPLHV